MTEYIQWVSDQIKTNASLSIKLHQDSCLKLKSSNERESLQDRTPTIGYRTESGSMVDSSR